MQLRQKLGGLPFCTTLYTISLDHRRVMHSAAAALTWLLRWGVGIQLDLVWKIVVLVMLHLLCQCLTGRLLECLLHINCLLGTRLK